MSTRKYVTEGCLNMLCSGPVLLQHQNLDHPQMLELSQDHNFHIYMICRRPRITFDPAFTTVDGRKVTGRFIVHTPQGQLPVPFSETMSVDPSERRLESDYPYNQVKILDGNGRLIVAFHAAHLMSLLRPTLLDPFHSKYVDLEVLYVGQAYGTDGERKAPDRLKSHETLLAIYAEFAASFPDDEIWLVLLAFDPPVLILSIDGRTESFGTTEVENDAHMLELIDDPIDDRQRICFAEAALIRYFQPIYNDKFKYNFPNPAHGTYSQCYDLDLNAIAVELQSEELHSRIYSHVVEPQWIHFIEFPLHSRELRKYMFDFD
jgi:hypothetical protein